MHMKGTPQDMQHRVGDVDITQEVHNYFQKKLDYLTEIGVNDVILDVGFGFGKSIDQNFDLLRNLADFKVFGKPLLVGISRKSMLY
jgi:dihydropteroate synthase